MCPNLKVIADELELLCVCFTLVVNTPYPNESMYLESV